MSNTELFLDLKGGIDKSLQDQLSLLKQQFLVLTASVTSISAALNAFDKGIGSLLNLQQAADRLNTSQENLKQFSDTLSSIGQVDLSSVTSGLNRFSIAAEATGASSQQVESLIITLTESLKRSGAAASEASASIIQLGQALASGKLSGDEFRSLSENAPLFLKKLSDALNLTIGELRAFSKEQQLTTDLIFGALGDSNEELIKSFSELPKTIGGSLQELENLFIKLGQSGLGSTIAEAISNIGEVLQGLAGIFPVIAAAAGVYAVNLIKINGLLTASTGLEANLNKQRLESIELASKYEQELKNLNDTLKLQEQLQIDAISSGSAHANIFDKEIDKTKQLIKEKEKQINSQNDIRKSNEFLIESEKKKQEMLRGSHFSIQNLVKIAGSAAFTLNTLTSSYEIASDSNLEFGNSLKQVFNTLSKTSEFMGIAVKFTTSYITNLGNLKKTYSEVNEDIKKFSQSLAQTSASSDNITLSNQRLAEGYNKIALFGKEAARSTVEVLKKSTELKEVQEELNQQFNFLKDAKIYDSALISLHKLIQNNNELISQEQINQSIQQTKLTQQQKRLDALEKEKKILDESIELERRILDLRDDLTHEEKQLELGNLLLNINRQKQDIDETITKELEKQQELIEETNNKKEKLKELEQDNIKFITEKSNIEKAVLGQLEEEFETRLKSIELIKEQSQFNFNTLKQLEEINKTQLIYDNERKINLDDRISQLNQEINLLKEIELISNKTKIDGSQQEQLNILNLIKEQESEINRILKTREEIEQKINITKQLLSNNIGVEENQVILNLLNSQNEELDKQKLNVDTLLQKNQEQLVKSQLNIIELENQKKNITDQISLKERLIKIEQLYSETQKQTDQNRLSLLQNLQRTESNILDIRDQELKINLNSFNQRIKELELSLELAKTDQERNIINQKIQQETLQFEESNISIRRKAEQEINKIKQDNHDKYISNILEEINLLTSQGKDASNLFRKLANEKVDLSELIKKNKDAVDSSFFEGIRGFSQALDSYIQNTANLVASKYKDIFDVVGASEFVRSKISEQFKQIGPVIGSFDLLFSLIKRGAEEADKSLRNTVFQFSELEKAINSGNIKNLDYIKTLELLEEQFDFVDKTKLTNLFNELQKIRKETLDTLNNIRNANRDLENELLRVKGNNLQALINELKQSEKDLQEKIKSETNLDVKKELTEQLSLLREINNEKIRQAREEEKAQKKKFDVDININEPKLEQDINTKVEKTVFDILKKNKFTQLG